MKIHWGIFGKKKEEYVPEMPKYYDCDGKEIRVGDIVMFLGTEDLGSVWEIEIWPGVRDMVFWGPLSAEAAIDDEAIMQLGVHKGFTISVPVKYFQREQLKIWRAI